MRVSAVIPSHNRAHMLARALQSVLRQSRPPDEILLVDDGSSDATADLVRGFPSVRYVYQDQGGVSSARNFGAREAQGDWIAFLDSDDEWLPEKLATQIAALETHPGMRICHTEEIWVRHGRRVNAMRKHAKAGGRIFLRCLPLCVISPSSVLLERRLLEELGGFDESLPACEDYDLWLRVCARYPVLFLDNPLIIKYGGHTDQLSQRHWGMDRYRIQSLEKLVSCPHLEHHERLATIDTIIHKSEILRQGAEKRGIEQRACHYRGKQRAYVRLRAQLQLQRPNPG